MAAKTVGIATQGVAYFFSLLDTEAEKADVISTLVAVYRGSVAADLFDLPILAVEHSWTRHVWVWSRVMQESSVFDLCISRTADRGGMHTNFAVPHIQAKRHQRCRSGVIAWW